jgi:ankyrin repeat protein
MLGREGCLRVLHELGVSLAVVATDGGTPAHFAAMKGQEGCLWVLHELGVNLAVADSHGDTPAHIAVMKGQEGCLRVLHELGVSLAVANADGITPALLAAEVGQGGCLRVLHEFGLLDLKTKQAWLVRKLEAVVGNADAAQLMLESNRANLLGGLCAQLGIDEHTGRLIAGDAALARGINVRRLKLCISAGAPLTGLAWVG